MSNMSYCRFENTSYDLQDCLDAIQNGETDELNPDEKRGLRRILNISRKIIDMEEDIINTLENQEEYE